MAEHGTWDEMKAAREGLGLRKELGGAHFLRYLLGGMTHENGVPVAQWECRDCGAVVTLDAHQRMIWRQWVSWRLRQTDHTLELVGRRLNCG